MQFTMSLNPPQQEAVEENGVQLIVAGPGSGKTRVITQKILHLIREGVPPETILALTFSDKAAEEMVERLERDIDPSDLTIATFHSFCLQVLKDNVLDSGISLSSGHIDRANQLVWALRNVDTFGFEYLRIGNNAVEVIESVIDGISAFRDELITSDELEVYLKEKQQGQVDEEEREYLRKLCDLLKVWKAYEQYRRDEDLIDFDDMIAETSRIFDEDTLIVKRYRARYQHILVDEFQDTNYAQLYLIKQLAGDNVCVVGDDDQSIYRFRGAYLTNFRDFRNHFRSTKVVLENNYRNSKNILRLALQLMAHAPNREEKTLTTENPDGDCITVARCENDQAEASFVCDEVLKLVGTPVYRRAEDQTRPLTYRDFAILSRQRVDGIKFNDTLLTHGIPAEFVGDVDFFSEPIIRDLIAYLNVVENPLRAGDALARIMRASGISEVDVQRINARAEKLAWEDDASDGVFESMLAADQALGKQATHVKEIAVLLQQIIAQKDRGSLSRMVYDIMVRYSGLYKKSLQHEDTRNIQLLNRFYEITQQYESITKHPSISDFLEYLEYLGALRIELEERDERNSVKIMTVHQSKGREFPVVFVADVAQRKFPLQYRTKPFYVPNDLSRGLKTSDDERSLYEQEERRLLYVAMTRAEQRLYLTYAERYGMNKTITKPSQFLMELVFDKNPLINVTDVTHEGLRNIATLESPIEKARKELQDHVVTATYQMRLTTAVQKLIELEKLRLLETGADLGAFKLEEFMQYHGGDDEALLRLIKGERVPLISDDHRFSASALRTYDECPMKYKLGYVLKVPTGTPAYFSFGSLMHEVIHQLALKELDGAAITRAMASELLERLWPSAIFGSKLEDAERKVRAEQMLDTYLEWLEYNDNELVAAEVEFLFPLNDRNVKGYIDRLERTKDGDYVVIDFKTGSTSLSKNTIRNDIQMNTYCLAVLHKFGTLPKRASLVYIERNKMVNYAPDAEHVERQKVRLEGLISDVLSEEFHATPSFDCTFCGYGGLCDHEKRSR